MRYRCPACGATHPDDCLCYHCEVCGDFIDPADGLCVNEDCPSNKCPKCGGFLNFRDYCPVCSEVAEAEDAC